MVMVVVVIAVIVVVVIVVVNVSVIIATLCIYPWGVELLSSNPCSKVCLFSMLSNRSITPVNCPWGQLPSNISTQISRLKMLLFCISALCLAEALVMNPTFTAVGAD